MGKRLRAVASRVALVAVSSSVRAQEVQITGPIVIARPIPATVEVASWLAAGAGFRKDEAGALASLSAGADATFAVATFRSGRFRSSSEIRIGPWLGIESPLDRLRGEGGLAWVFGDMGDYAAVGLALQLRLGAGSSTTGIPHVVGTSTFGVRAVPSHAEKHSICDPRKTPSLVGIASGVSLFTTMRAETSDARAVEVLFGLEIGPLFCAIER